MDGARPTSYGKFPRPNSQRVRQQLPVMMTPKANTVADVVCVGKSVCVCVGVYSLYPDFSETLDVSLGTGLGPLGVAALCLWHSTRLRPRVATGRD